MTQKRWLTALSAIVIPAAVAQAGVWREVAFGLDQFGYQFSGQRNYLGNGWDINLNAVYTGQDYNFGFADLKLGSSATPTLSTIQAGYTLRGIPQASFSWSTNGNALPYTLKINNGIQDFTTINGSMLADVSTDINVLGFYDTRIDISNRGSYSTEGFLGQSDGSLAFDVGPIDISGNIYADALAAITDPFFTAAGQENPFAKFSSRSVKEANLKSTIADLQARAQAGEILTDEEMATLVNSMLLSAIITGDSSDGNMFTGLVTPASLQLDDVRSGSNFGLVPEPGSLLLLGGMAMCVVPRRRRRCDRA